MRTLYWSRLPINRSEVELISATSNRNIQQVSGSNVVYLCSETACRVSRGRDKREAIDASLGVSHSIALKRLA